MSVKRTIWYFLKKQKSTGQLSNIKKPQSPRKPVKMDDHRFFAWLRKTPNNISPSQKHF